MEDFERPYKKVAAIKAVLLFVFRRRAFIEMAVKHDQAWVLSTSPDLRDKYLSGTYRPDDGEIRKTVEARTSALRRSLRASALLVIGSAALAIVVGQLLSYKVGSPDSMHASVLQIVSALQIAGVGLLLWAAIWELGWDVRSVGGESLPERVHQWLFRLLFVLGTFSLFLSEGWKL